MAKTTIKVKGTVGFYGKVSKLKGEGKVFRLVIENPEFTNVTEENLEEMYGDGDWKENTFYRDLIEKGSIDVFMAHSNFEVENIWYNHEYMSVDDFEEKTHEVFALNNAEIEMICRKGYIGQIKIIKNGKPYNPFE